MVGGSLWSRRKLNSLPWTPQPSKEMFLLFLYVLGRSGQGGKGERSSGDSPPHGRKYVQPMIGVANLVEVESIFD